MIGLSTTAGTTSILTKCQMLGIAIFALAAASAFGQNILTAPVGQLQDYPLDSGPLDNASNDPQSVFRAVVQIEGAAWLRLYFDDVTLREGSTMIVTSLADNAKQHHSADTIAEWYNTSAYFNGNAVEIELIAGAGTTGNRFILGQVAYQMAGGSVAGSLCGICDVDDRLPTEERWTGRLMPVGCTASMYNTSGCFVSAGHCMGFAFVQQFQVPLSNPDGSLQHPGPEDQYMVRESSIAFINGGVGLDWGYFTCFANTETELTAIEAQGDYRPIATELPDEFPVEIVVVGYGVAEVGELSQAQKRGVGALAGIESGFGSQEPAWYHRVDTTGGNSGSSITYNDKIIGIVSHCTTDCPNIGTLINQSDFVDARSACPARRGDCDLDEDTDAFDITNWASCATGPRVGPPPSSCSCNNYDGDTHIDLFDVYLLQNGQTGNLCTVPEIDLSSQSQIVCEFNNLVLFSDATSNHELTYAWWHDGVPIEGADGPTLVIDSVEGDGGGNYSLLTANLCGESLSESAEITLCSAHVFSATFAEDTDWIVVSDPNMIRGQWFRHNPTQTLFNGYVDQIVQPGFDSPYDADGRCYGTGPFGGQADSNDVDGGPTVLYSPMIDLTGHANLSLIYDYWFYRDNDDGDDGLEVSISNDAGQSWIQLIRHEEKSREWRSQIFNSVPSVITPTNQVQLRFSIQDAGGETLLEALIDNVRILAAD